MKLVVVTEQQGKDWFANCYEQIVLGAGRGFQKAPRGPIGNAGPKRSEPAAASGAIGDFFRRRKGGEG